jgi:hypothetical protein
MRYVSKHSVNTPKQQYCVFHESVQRSYLKDNIVIQNHDNENVHNIGLGEANHRKYKRLKLGGGQAYDRSSV